MTVIQHLGEIAMTTETGFECLYCGYTKDLSRHVLPSGMSWFFASLLGILLTLVMIMGV